MDNALLIGLSRQMALGRELDVVANNLANPMHPVKEMTMLHCHGVRRNGQELGLGTLVSHAEENCGQEEREAVQRAKAAHVDDGVSPGLPVDKRSGDVPAVDMSNGGTSLSVSAETAHGAKLLLWCEEPGSVWEIENHPPAEDTHKDGHETLNDKDPAPAIHD
ncbi:MAG: hypothetical protein M1823_006609 [Watsoniomyces obsoletus]|nr:MAG: hypothetical protein M1823_006609 [Watsoniomyces obsoletus]